ncbi:orotate phosphoribosyltransferase [Thermosulfidibacter takaii ABI70S6]|uniref:Orotate phosphoribosyltransferase n=1 Tax=Thermosulfidibacter takaii (strain DSM 17441 / JCM 13301 / NBRC 103674 / ABI70S6) TaxID=1298851 RepID=A0A0S3QT11_THET7|nr:PilZ domain-containing protein [Thermosulfidibacter takaii]BAT71474.1 orotate phosphoribosyltransferase [Thermosulfidibacter takaii ABI70S6]
MDEDRRRFKRVKFEVLANVFGEGFVKKGVVTKDLSVKGAFIVSNEKPSLGSVCELKLFLTQAGKIVEEVSLKGEVVRKEKNGFAVEFKEIPLKDFITLKRIVDLNFGFGNDS